MEGLIPYVYRAIVRYRAGGQAPTAAAAAGSWLKESPSFSYARLPGDSGRFQPSSSETGQVFRLERVFSSSSSSPSTMAAVSTSTSQSLLCRTASRRLVSSS